MRSVAQAAEDSASAINTKRVLDPYEAMAGTGGGAPATSGRRSSWKR